MADVYDIADFFVQLVNQSTDDQITNLKLNKLLYYAQGVYIARTNKPLFNNSIEAWTYGPVVPDVYQKYKVCGKNPIPSIGNNIDRSKFSDLEFETMIDVMIEYGKYTSSALVDMTHKPGTPWSTTISNGKTIIDLNSIKEFFINNPVSKFEEKINIPKIDKLPSDWYDADEDTIWEEYL